MNKAFTSMRRHSWQWPLISGLCLVVIAVLSLLYLNFHEEHKQAEWVDRTHQVLNQGGRVLSNLQDAESGQRGYLLTGNDSYLEPFRRAVQRDPIERQALRRLMADSPSQGRHIDRLDRLANAELTELQSTIALRQKGNVAAALAIVESGRGKRLMDECRDRIQTIEDQNFRLLNERAGLYATHADRVRWILLVGGFFWLGFLIFAGVLIGRHTSLREGLQETTRTLDLAHAMVRNLDGTILYATHGLCTFYGLYQHEVLGRRTYDVFRTELPKPFEQIMADLRGNGEWVGELKQYKADGTPVWVASHWALEELPNGEVRVIEVNNDVTAQKLAEQKGRQSLERLEKVLEIETVGVMFWDLNTGAMCDANDTFLKLMGYSRSEVERGELFWQNLTPPEYMDVSRAEVEKFLATGRVGPYEKEYFHKDGTKQWFLFAGSSLGDNQCVEFCIDISDRKKAEQALRESQQQLQEFNAELENRVRERTAQLEAANKELEAFAYSVSHDLRAPLRAIEGFTKILQRDYSENLDEKALNLMDRMRSASQRMGQLIDDLLSLSRVSRQEMKRQAIDLGTVAEAVISECSSRDPERSVQIEIEPGLIADADPRLIRIALDNLLGNAWKYTGKTESARITVGSNENHTFFVRDNGIGFDMAHADQLFAPFQRLHPAGEFEGTGIGLATVQRIIHRHGGRIWVEASPKQGATFYFTFGEQLCPTMAQSC